jgi:hypothetical protein
MESPYVDESLGIISACFNIAAETLITFLHSSDTWEKIGMQRNSASGIHRLQE